MINARFQSATLNSSFFYVCGLPAADFTNALLTNARFESCIVNEATLFKQVSGTNGFTIDRFTLECLGSGRGGLTPGNLMVMNIQDDVAKLRAEFGGVWGIIHLVSLTIFAAPYLWFLVSHYSMARWDRGEAEQSTMLGIALLKFIASGGATWKHWQFSLSLILFVVYLIYNFVRLCLVWKTKTLETEQEVTGYPADFRLANSRWKLSYDLVHSMFWIGVGLVGLNSLYFLAVRVPISP